MNDIFSLHRLIWLRFIQGNIFESLRYNFAFFQESTFQEPYKEMFMYLKAEMKIILRVLKLNGV